MALKINFLIPSPGVGGGVRVVADHARYLMDKGHDVEVIGRGRERYTLKRRVHSLRLRKLDLFSTINTSLFDDTGVRLKTWDNVKRLDASHIRDADITIATWWETARWLDGLPESKGVKAHFIQGHEAALPHGYPRKFVDDVHRLPARKIVVSHWLKDVMRREYGIEDCIVVENGVDTNRFSAPDRVKPGRPTVGFVFSVTSVKNSALAINACEELRERYKDLHVVTFGSSKPDATAPLPRWISFRHMPPQKLIPSLYGQCSVWLFTSREEGFGLPVLEAMACGTPVVATGAGAAPEIVTAPAGEIVDMTVEAFTQAASRYLDMPDAEWRAASLAARARAECFSQEKSGAAFEKALVELTGNT